MSYRRSPCLLLCILAATLVASLGSDLASASPTQYRGVQLHSLWGDSTDADMARDLDMSRNMGANVVRVDVGWQTLEENGKGVYSQWYVDKLDRFVSGASARGLKVILTLVGTPCWASSAPDDLKQNCAPGWWSRGVGRYPPNRAADYGDISRWVTGRYGSRLAALELWNEPNLTDFLRASDPAAAYARMVKAGYSGAKQGDASVPVLAGALARGDASFLSRLYNQGIKGYYDAISIHPYNEQRDPAAVIDDKWKEYTFLAGTQWVHQTQVAHGDSTRLWLTEFGWSTCTTGSTWCVSEAQQAAYTPKAFRLMAGMPYVDAGTVYNLRDKGTDPVAIEPNYGLINRDFSPKPAYLALRAAFTGSATETARPTSPTSGTAANVGPRRSLGVSRMLGVRLVRHGGKAFAIGRGPASTLVRLTVWRVRRIHGHIRRTPRRHMHARTNSAARFARSLGPLNRPGHYVVVAKVAG